MLRNEQIVEFFQLVRDGNLDAIRILPDLKKLASEARNQKGQTALHIFLEASGFSIVRALRSEEEAKADDINRMAILELLVANNADPNAKDNDGNTPLMLARDVNVAEFLISKGAEVNVINHAGKSPLAIAHREATAIIPCLLANKAKLESDCDDNMLPVIVASAGQVLGEMKDPSVLKFAMSQKNLVQRDQAFFNLLEQHPTINVNAVNKATGDSALHIVVGRNSTQGIRRLLDMKADPNLKNKSEVTPLMHVTSCEAVQLLIQRGAHPKAKDKDDKTALHHAVNPTFGKNQDTVPTLTKLMAEGCPVDDKDKSGKSPKETAKDPEIVEYLEDTAARQIPIYHTLSFLSRGICETICCYAVESEKIKAPAPA